jgi:hypothetical protein
MLNLNRYLISCFLAVILILANVERASAFCGFYVGGADAKIFNKASQVVIARNGKRTILTMANDFQGAVKDFAMVVPVPVAIKKEQVHVGKRSTIEKLDLFSQPRLVEYFDRDPCIKILRSRAPRGRSYEPPTGFPSGTKKPADLGVTVEDKFKVNEYEIVILSAKESDGLETWLRQNNYNIPTGASELLAPYIKQNLKFFVAKIDLQEFTKSGSKMLRPLQIAYQSPKFMLPIRLGTINAQGEQDLVIYMLSPKGRVEVTNYRTVKVPTDRNIPTYIEKEFSSFYQALFQRVYEKERKQVAFLEYAWDTNNCDPCSSEPPTKAELKAAGVFWGVSDENEDTFTNSRYSSDRNRVFMTRLHVRYTRDKFPEDLMFHETGDEETFQGRYVMNHPYTGKLTCPDGEKYRQNLRPRLEKEANDLAELTGWNLKDIYRKIDFSIASPQKTDNDNFWQNIWKSQ